MHARTAVRALTTVGILVGLALPGTSYAEAFKHADPAKDVQSVDETGGTDQPSNKTADITRATFNHTNTQLKTSLKLRDLAKKWIVVSEIKTPDASFVGFGSRTASGTDFSLSKASGKPVTCDGITASQDKTKHTITFAIPTSCLGTPTWVKAGVGAVVGSSTLFADDALRKGGASENHLTLSPKIHRG